MNGKRILFLAAIAAFAFVAMPSANAATTAPITVKWNTLATGTITVVTNYSNTGAQQITAPTVLTQNNTGIGTCTAPGSESAGPPPDVNFGNVTADTAKVTNCTYENGWFANVVTSDPNGYNVTVTATTAPTGGYWFCAYKNGSWANNNTTVTQSSGTAVSQTTAGTCNAGGVLMSSATAQTVVSNPGSGTTGTDLGADMVLSIPANGATGAQTITDTFTLNLL